MIQLSISPIEWGNEPESSRRTTLPILHQHRIFRTTRGAHSVETSAMQAETRMLQKILHVVGISKQHASPRVTALPSLPYSAKNYPYGIP